MEIRKELQRFLNNKNSHHDLTSFIEKNSDFQFIIIAVYKICADSSRHPSIIWGDVKAILNRNRKVLPNDLIIDIIHLVGLVNFEYGIDNRLISSPPKVDILDFPLTGPTFNENTKFAEPCCCLAYLLSNYFPGLESSKNFGKLFVRYSRSATRIPVAFTNSILNTKENVGSYLPRLGIYGYANEPTINEIVTKWDLTKLKPTHLLALLGIFKLYQENGMEIDGRYVVHIDTKSDLAHAAGYKPKSKTNSGFFFNEQIVRLLFLAISDLASHNFPIAYNLNNEIIATYEPLIKFAYKDKGASGKAFYTIEIHQDIMKKYAECNRLIPSNIYTLIQSAKGVSKKVCTHEILFILYLFNRQIGAGKLNMTTISWSKLAKQLHLTTYLNKRKYKLVHEKLDDCFDIAKKLKYILTVKKDYSKNGIVSFSLNFDAIFSFTQIESAKNTIFAHKKEQITHKKEQGAHKKEHPP